MSLAFLNAIGMLWLAWFAYWWISSLQTKQAERVDGAGVMLTYRVPMVLGALLLVITDQPSWLAGVSWLWWRCLPDSATWSALGLGLVVLGLGYSCWARVALGRNWSATVQLKRDHELIIDGPYRWTRHPIYTGMLLALVGTALAIGEWRGLPAIVLVFVGLWFKLRHEEAWMRERFGAAYTHYMHRVRALIPGIL